jgi:acyl-CoA synthetase (AMP-forming)/AMP-acid ligase II
VSAVTALLRRPGTAGTAEEAAPVSLEALIRERADAFGDRIYLEESATMRALSFADLAGELPAWRTWLDEQGTAPGRTVALSVASPIDFARAFLLTLAAERWVAPLDHRNPGVAARQADIVGAGLLVSQHDRALRTFDTQALGAPSAPTPGGGDTSGIVLSSSGTTGTPKVIPISTGQALITAGHVAENLRLTTDDRGFNPLPLFHINAEVVGLLSSLVSGSTLVLADRFHRTGFWQTMAQHSITWINAVPAIVTLLTELVPGESVPPFTRLVRSASAPLAPSAMRSFEEVTGLPVVETYGMTEAGSQITANPLDGPRKPGSVGLPVGVELRIADSASAADDGLRVVGEVELRGPSVITPAQDHRNALRFSPDGWLRTGDLGSIDADGYLFLAGRTDDVINRSGEKIFPRHIEETLLTQTEVTGAAVVGRPDPILGEVPVAYLVLEAEVDVPAVLESVTGLLRDAIVPGHRPVELFVVGALPVGPTGKVRPRMLREGNGPVDVLASHRCPWR